jgi:hypothetical protein
VEKQIRPATSSSTRGASLSVLKREAAARRVSASFATVRDRTRDDRFNTDDEHDREPEGRGTARGGAHASKKRPGFPGRRAERNASVYNRLLRESRRSAAARRAGAGAGKENDDARVSLGAGEPVAQTAGSRNTAGHTTTEDEGGGYWATTEPDDACTSDADDRSKEEPSRSEETRRARVDAGGPDANAGRTPSVSEETVDEGDAVSESRASSKSFGPRKIPGVVFAPKDGVMNLKESRALESEDEDDDARGDDADARGRDDDVDTDSIASDANDSSASFFLEDSFASASSDPEAKDEDAPSEAETSESARRDPDPDDVDVVATLREDNLALRAKLREAADAIAASTRERAEASEEQTRARKDAETRDAEIETLRAEAKNAIRREKRLEKAVKKAESEVRRAVLEVSVSERRAADAEARARDAEARATDAEARARDATRLGESAVAAAEISKEKISTLADDLRRANEALAQMTEACEEAQLEAKATMVWRVARGENSETPDAARFVDDAAQKEREANASAAEAAARALAAAAAEAEAILVAGPEAIDPLDLESTPRGREDIPARFERAFDAGVARSLVSAARRAVVDAGLRDEELASLRSALNGETAAAKRAEREMAKLRARMHDSEADAHAAWTALDVERARVRALKTEGLAPEATRPKNVDPPGFRELLGEFSLPSPGSPSLAGSDVRAAMETDVAALDEVAARLDARGGTRDEKGGSNRVATPGSENPTGSKNPTTPKDDFAFDVDIGPENERAEKEIPCSESTRSRNRVEPSPPHPPLPLPRWPPPNNRASAAAASVDSPAMINLRTPTLERWAKR